MVEARITVKGYLALESACRENARRMMVHNPPEGSEAWNAAMRELAYAEKCRVAAYELLGVVTIPQPTQLSFFEAL